MLVQSIGHPPETNQHADLRRMVHERGGLGSALIRSRRGTYRVSMSTIFAAHGQ